MSPNRKAVNAVLATAFGRGDLGYSFPGDPDTFLVTSAPACEIVVKSTLSNGLGPCWPRAFMGLRSKAYTVHWTRVALDKDPNRWTLAGHLIVEYSFNQLGLEHFARHWFAGSPLSTETELARYAEALSAEARRAASLLEADCASSRALEQRLERELPIAVLLNKKTFLKLAQGDYAEAHRSALSLLTLARTDPEYGQLLSWARRSERYVRNLSKNEGVSPADRPVGFWDGEAQARGVG